MTQRTFLDRLYALSPMGMALGLDRVRRAAERLGNPQDTFSSVQIAGTNGKGTVSMVVAHAAALAGVETGLFTSPHLHRFSERIRINGAECDEERLEAHLFRVLDVTGGSDPIPLTFFEAATLTAFSVFAEARVELAVLEVGLGGRLDATSVASPVLTAVTSVGLDHQAVLGNTLAAIAREKGAIARRGVPMVLGNLAPEPLRALLAAAKSAGAPVAALGRDFGHVAHLASPWPGAHQRDNLAVAAALFSRLEALNSRCTSAAFGAALSSVTWPGRFERKAGSPSWIFDCAHNDPAVTALVQALEETDTHPTVLLFGALRDKPAAEMLARLRPRVGRVVLVPPPIERALNPASIASPGDDVCLSISDSVRVASRRAGDRGTVLVTGSVFTVGAVRGLILGERSDPAAVGL